MFILAGVFSFLLAGIVRWWMTRTYTKWGQVANRLGVNGQQVARHILDSNGLHGVRLEESKGQLSDHYIPSQKLIRLSEHINREPSVASIAVAAHEVGHAIQDAGGYRPLKAKAVMMPIAALGNQLGMGLALGGGFLGSSLMLDIGMILVAASILTQLITLPIEFDASKRALHELQRLGMVDERDHDGAREMLRAAAMTYVANAASSLAFVAVFALGILRRR